MTEDPVIAIDCRMQVLPKSYYKTVMLQVVLTKKKNQTHKQTNYFCCMLLIATIAMLLG